MLDLLVFVVGEMLDLLKVVLGVIHKRLKEEPKEFFFNDLPALIVFSTALGFVVRLSVMICEKIEKIFQNLYNDVLIRLKWKDPPKPRRKRDKAPVKILDNVKCSQIMYNPDIFDMVVLGCLDIMKQSGIDLNIRSSDGKTLANAAVKMKNVKYIEFLAAQERFDSWNVADSFGETPIMMALKLKRNKRKIIEILLGCPRVDLSCRDNDGWSLLFRAIQRKELGEKMIYQSIMI